ncbi:hypothetical protein ACM26V_12300 [Salipaludibacillus sp. HK11]|uniref:hypothetical protein n=1 Tax=Salipaludibacillus sp. HK11 TaxID=3394320 RepID=UPI0039FC79CF
MSFKVNFEGGNLTSDSGLILYKEFDKKIGLSKTIKKSVSVKDHTHSNEEVMIQKGEELSKRTFVNNSLRQRQISVSTNPFMA